MNRVRARSAAEWADACSNAFVPLRVRSASPRFAATLERVELTPGVSVTRVASAGSEVVRTAQTIAEHPRDDLLVSVHRSGRGRVAQYGREVDLTTGRAALYDASAPYRLSFPGRMSEIVLQVPRGLIARTGHAFTDLTATALPVSAGMIALQNLLSSIDPQMSHQAPLIEREMLADATTTLLRASLLSVDRAVPPAVDNQTLARSLRTYIDDHLTDPTLTVETLAIANHVSVRLVYKVFADHLDDSPGDYLRRARLSVAHRQLTSGRSVLDAAVSSGFAGPDTFTRAFRRRYGYPPSAVKNASRD